jgi:hypothetical protein
MVNSKEFIATNSVNLVNESDKNLFGSITVNSSGHMVFTDEFTANTYKFDKPDTKIGSLTLEEISEYPTGINVNDIGQISFSDTKSSSYLSDIVTDIDVIQLLDKLNTVGSIYDFKIQQLTFGDYKYANVKFCKDIANTFGYFSIDKILNDDRSRQIFQNEQAAIYKGTDKEALFPPYAGFLRDQNYQVDGWINIDYLIHVALGNNFAYDSSSSLSIRTKPFQDAKRVIIMMVLNYVNDMFSLGSYNKLSDFGVRIVDRNTDQEIDLSHIQTNVTGQLGTNLLSTYIGKLKYTPTTIYDTTVPHISDNSVNNCDKKYINKCDNVIFTLKDSPEKEDIGCPTCLRHEIGVEVRVNPHADTRINKLDIQNTIDPIHWTTGLVSETRASSGDRTVDIKNINYDNFKNLIDEFGEKQYTVGTLNESRGFAAGAGTYELGLIAGGFSHDKDSAAKQVRSTETWNGTSWLTVPNADLPTGRSLGIMGGGYKQAIYAFGASLTFNAEDNPSTSSLHVENDTVIWNGTSWFTPTPYTLAPPNIARHSVGGKLDIQITITDENKSPTEIKEDFNPHAMFGDNFLMKDSDFYKLVSQQNPNQDTTWYALTRFSGFVFGGRTDSSFNLFNVDHTNVSNIFEYVSWGDMTRYTYNVSGASISATQSGTWMVDPTRNYPVNAYGMCYVGTDIKGLSTGGKTGKSQDDLQKAYIYPTTFDEFESPVLNLAYEYNGVTWIRRDNMPESVYYHAGVGDITNSIFWGGLHGSVEEPHIYDTMEVFEDWEVIVNRFGGTNHRNGTFGIDGSLRYSLFPTKLEDSYNTWFQIGDKNDYLDTNKPFYGTTASGGIYENFIPQDVNSVISNTHTIKVSKIIDENTLSSTTYFDGEAWNSSTIRAGDTKEGAYGEPHINQSKFSYLNEIDTKKSYRGNYIKNSDETISDAFVPDGVFAERYNISNSLNSDYCGHTIKGGMWLWSRPSVGEKLFHPDNFLVNEGINVESDDIVNQYIKHSFTPDIFGETSGSNTLHSFFINYENGRNNGLDQYIYEGSVKQNELVFIEKWEMPEKFNEYFTETSELSGLNIKVNNNLIKANTFNIKFSSSYNKFNTSLDALFNVDTITNKSEFDKFIELQFRVEETDYNDNLFVYDINRFKSWTYDTSGKNFHPVSYDGFRPYFSDNNENKVTTSNYVRSSSIRDKSALFPWCDLLSGDSTNHARKGSTTWNWVRELTSSHGIPTYNTFIIVAETIFADYITPGSYTKPDKTQAITETTFWREIFKISKYDKIGNEIWAYEITYDENDTSPETNREEYWIESTYPLVGTLFGTSINNRDLNDGVSLNETVDENGNINLRTVNLWNAKTINPLANDVSIVANEQQDMTYINWKKTSASNIPVSLYSENRLNLIDMISNEYKLTETNALSIVVDGSASNWFLCMPGETFDGMIVADSKLAFNPSSRTVTNPDESYKIYSDISIPVSTASPGLVKEFISSYTWDISGVWKIVKAYSASEISKGYISQNYGKSTYPLPPVTDYPINANIDNNAVKNLAKYAFPWNYLLNDPTMYIELVDDTGMWFAYGDYTNIKITSPEDTHINVYHIGHIPASNYQNLKKLTLGKNIYDNIQNILLNGSSSSYRHKESILELINTQHGEQLFDVFITMSESNDTKPYGKDVGYYQPISIIPDPNELPSDPVPETYCCDIDITKIGCVVCDSPSISGCSISLVSNNLINDSSNNGFSCFINNDNSDTLPSWEQHNREEWAVPYIESPFAGPFGNSDFNVWVSSGKSDTTRWGNIIFNQVPQDGDLIANFKAHRIGTDVINNKVYLSTITASISIDKFDEIDGGDINIPCKIVYDEYIYPTQFSTETVNATGYALLPFINDIVSKSNKFKKDSGIFSSEPVIIYVPERYGCGVSGAPLYYYTEWGTNFIQEFKNKTSSASDYVDHKYYFTHDTEMPQGSSTHNPLPDPSSFKIIETDWRRYQDGVGLGGDIPDMNSKNCLPLKQWYIGQTAIGTADKAVIAGGYCINSGDNTSAPNTSDSWWYLNTEKKTFKWNKSVINPEDMYNKNYTKRNFSPFFSNGENTFSNSMLSCIMFDVGKKSNCERRGTVDFRGNTNKVSVVFDEPIPEIFTNKNMYSISMAPNNNVKIWWSDKTENGFTISCEINNWVGSVDWSIFYVEDISKDSSENNLGEQDTYDQFKNL